MQKQQKQGCRNMVGPQLRRLRIERELSQRGLAELLQRSGWDISRDTIAKIEDQRRWVSDFELAFLADQLELPITNLFPSRMVDRPEHYIQRLEKRIS